MVRFRAEALVGLEGSVLVVCWEKFRGIWWVAVLGILSGGVCWVLLGFQGRGSEMLGCFGRGMEA